MAEQLLDDDRLLTREEVLKLTGGFSYSTIWKWMRDNRFPRSLLISGRVRWLESEIRTWRATLPRQKLKGDPPSEPGGQCVNFKKNEGSPQ